MKNTDMTILETKIFNAIKEHCADIDRPCLAENMPVEFIDMEETNSNSSFTCYAVKTRQHTNDYEDNISVWSVYIYTDEKCSVYFDDTLFMSEFLEEMTVNI